MKKTTSILAAGLFATTALSGMTGAVAQDYSSIKSLPVITDDCGATSCRDIRRFTIDQFRSILADGMGREAAMQAAAAGGGEGGTKSRGLAVGQDVNDTQIVYLDFDQSSPTFEAITFGGVQGTFVSHVYTPEERDAVQANLESRYVGYNVEFTQTLPTEGEFTTLNFECEDPICIDFGGGILFGRAESIDIRNADRGDSAFIDVNLWETLVQLVPDGSFFSAISGVPIVDGDVEGALSFAVINQASNTGAHELGHILGLRHHDSFGDPGTGVTTGTGPFFPPFDGPFDATESFNHVMASGASVGTGFTDSTLDLRFFSERSAIKLANGERSRVVSEEAVSGGNKKVQLNRVIAPNSLESGINADGQLDLREALIAGSIDEADEVDSYRFRAKAGQFLNAEFFSFTTPPPGVTDLVIGAVALFFVEDDGSLTFVRGNLQSFEGLDALLVDAPLEQDGEYVLQVFAPDLLDLGGPELFSLEANGFGALRTGEYEVSMYITNGRPGNGPSRVPGAS